MNYILVGIVVSLVLTGVIFLASSNISISILIFSVSMLFFIIIARRLINKGQLKAHRYHECFHFINSFIVSLNTKGSMGAAIESGYGTSDDETKAMLDSIRELNEEEKLSYLTKYFRFDLYRLFVDTVSLWNEQGGDILKMSQYLLNQARLKEEYLLTCESMQKRKTIEFAILWAISLGILSILRFALLQFFERIRNALFYQVSVVVIALFVLFSIYVLIKRITKVEIEGWDNEEK